MQTLFQQSPGEHKLQLDGPAGSIEAILSAVESPTAIAVVCHPHPLHGGAMTNKVTHTLAKALTAQGVTNLRFNFRGVGASEGTYDEGRGETDDLTALVNQLKAAYPELPLLLAGFSFGSWVSSRAAKRLVADAVISIAPPVARFDFSEFTHPDCPWLIVMGEEDEVVSPEEVFYWVDSLAPAPELIRYPETGHFFHGKLIPLREDVEAFIASLNW